MTTPADPPADPGRADGPDVREPTGDQAWRPPSWRVRVIAIGLVAIAVGVLGLTGGLERATPPPAPSIQTVAIGTVVDTGPFQLTPRTAVAADSFTYIQPRDKDNYLLAVAIMVEARGPDSENSNAMVDLVSLPGAAGLTTPEPGWIALTRDSSEFDHLNPGMPEVVAFIFEIRAGTPLPAQINVLFSGYSAYFSFAQRRWEWTDFRPRARVDIPVDDKRVDKK